MGILPCMFFAQIPGEEELGAWYMYFGMNKIAEKWSIHSEVQFRYYETTTNFNQLLLRTGINYHINPNAIATFGYAFIETDGDFNEPVNESNFGEHRLFEQFILKNKVGKFDVEHRYRLEHRWLDFVDRNDFQNRARYRLQVTHPIAGPWFVNVYDEIFVNFQDNPFGQNRLFGALGYKASKSLSFQAGYLKNHFTNAHFDRLQLAVFYNPDLRKKVSTESL